MQVSPQCIYIIAGDLCGECKDGKGVSALLNRCTTCSDISGLLIALLCGFYETMHIIIFMFIITFHSGTGCSSVCSSTSLHETTPLLDIPMCLLYTGLNYQHLSIME